MLPHFHLLTIQNFNNCTKQTRDVFEKCTFIVLTGILIIIAVLCSSSTQVPVLSTSLIFISVCMCINVEFLPYSESCASSTIRRHSWWSSTNIYGTQFCLLSICLSFGSCLSFGMCHQIKHNICCIISQNFNRNIWVYFNRFSWNLTCASAAQLQKCMLNMNRI